MFQGVQQLQNAANSASANVGRLWFTDYDLESFEKDFTKIRFGFFLQLSSTLSGGHSQREQYPRSGTRQEAEQQEFVWRQLEQI